MTDDVTVKGVEEKDQAARDAAAKVADYEHGWSADIDTEFAPKGLSEDTVRFISAKAAERRYDISADCARARGCYENKNRIHVAGTRDETRAAYCRPHRQRQVRSGSGSGSKMERRGDQCRCHPGV